MSKIIWLYGQIEIDTTTCQSMQGFLRFISIYLLFQLFTIIIYNKSWKWYIEKGKCLIQSAVLNVIFESWNYPGNKLIDSDATLPQLMDFCVYSIFSDFIKISKERYFLFFGRRLYCAWMHKLLPTIPRHIKIVCTI